MLIPVIWSGLGGLTAVCVLLGVVVGVVLQVTLGQPGPAQPWPFAVGMAAAALVNLIIGLWLNRRSVRTAVDPRSGFTVTRRSAHSLYYLPVQWWTVPMLAFAGFLWMADMSERQARAAATAPEAFHKRGLPASNDPPLPGPAPFK